MKILLQQIQLILLLFFIGFNSLEAQTSPVKITPVNTLKNLTPGEHYTLVFNVSETIKASSTYTLNYQFPEEFQLLLAKKKISFNNKETQKLFVTFAVSPSCPAKEFNISIHILNNNNNIETYTTSFDVKKIFALEIEPLNYPEYLRLEKEYTASYTVTNTGNSEEKIRFFSTQSIAVKPATATLKPYENVIVEVTQKVPFSPYNTTIALNLLKAELVTYGNLFSSQIPITVYPNNNEKPDLYHRFPVSLSTIFNSLKGLDTISAFKYKVEGSGYLDRNNKHYLDFLFTGPNQIETTRFGEYDQYYINYRNDNLEVFAGDITYSLSYLTEMSRYGFGGLINYKIKDSYSRIFYLKPRFTDRIKEAYGADFTWQLAPKFNLRLGVINRLLFEDKKEFESQIYSLSSFYNSKLLKLNSEVAYEQNVYSSGYGFGVESYLNHKKYYWGNTVYYSDKNFKGYLRNSKQYSSRFNYKFNRKLNASAYVSYREINPVKDSINYNSSPIIKNYQTSLSYRINRNNRLRIGASYRTKEDRFTPKKFNFEENLITLNYTLQKINKYNLNILSNYGTTKNLLFENTEPQQVLYSTFEFSTFIWPSLNVGISADFERTNKNSVDNTLQNALYYSGSLRYQIRNKLNLNLFYRNDYAIDEIETDAKSYLEAQLELNLHKNHRLWFSASQASIPSYTNNVIDKELFINASYRFTLDVPLEKDKTKGILQGKINDVEDVNLEGILISLGNKATVTDKNGEFIIYNLEPKEYIVNIAESSLPKNKIIVENIPQQVEILPNKETYINLNLSNTGEIIGKVNLKEVNFTKSSQFNVTFPKLVVRISKEDKKYLTQTNKDGEFKFSKLTPGEWTVELIVKNIAQKFNFNKTKKIVTVSPNQATNVKFEISEKNRNIKKINKKFKL